jgi:peptidoglycan/xylan/chitin deacetylase (PgdA/CDA1 family)
MNPAPKRIEICPFPQDKRIAVTTSFDDGRVYDRQVVKAFNEWGLKGTFNLNSGGLTRTGSPAPADSRGHLDACEVASLYAGHEVAVHTVNHPHLPRLDPAQAALEVLQDRQALEDLAGYPVRGMAYPFGTWNAEVVAVLRSAGIVYSRTTEARMPCFPVTEPLAWPATMHQYAQDPEPMPQRWQKFYDNPRSNGVFFVWGHSYEFPDRNDWEGLERIYKPLSGKPDVWYCTNIELFDYEAARKRLVIAANRRTVFNPSAAGVWVKVDGKLLEVPGGKTVSLA